jgi:hypothetical protein
VSDLYSNWIPHLLGLLFILLLCLPTFYLDKIALRFQSHRQIRPEQVQSVLFYPTPEEKRTVSPEHVSQIIDWYNQSVFIQKRSSDGLKTQQPCLQIKLHSSDIITIFLSDTDIDIQRTITKSNSTVLYWAKQPHLREYLLHQNGTHSA